MSRRILAPARLEGMAATALAPTAAIENSLSLHRLTNEMEAEVIAFLAERSLHTVVMAGHIRDNRIESAFNRGQFYGCRNGAGQLEGVALLGHATLIDARSEAALAAFARLAQSCPQAHLIMGEQEKVERFWRYYARAGQIPRRVCRELLFEQQWPIEAREPVRELRLATLADLELVMPVQAEMAQAESGINPLEADPAGFRLRCARRIAQQRVWVWTANGQLIFKADIISETPQVIYLEGIYVNPQERGQGYGLRCLSQLGQALLARSQSLCVLVNEQSLRAQTFFERAGFKQRACYDTVFLERKEN